MNTPPDQVYMSQRLFLPEMNKNFHLFIYTQSPEKAAELTGTDRIKWIPIDVSDPAINLVHIESYYREAVAKPGIPVCDVLPLPLTFYPCGIGRLDCTHETAFFEVPENGDEQVTCYLPECGSKIPNDTVRLVIQGEETKKYLCRSCAEKVIGSSIRDRFQSCLDAISFQMTLRIKLFHEKDATVSG